MRAKFVFNGKNFSFTNVVKKLAKYDWSYGQQLFLTLYEYQIPHIRNLSFCIPANAFFPVAAFAMPKLLSFVLFELLIFCILCFLRQKVKTLLKQKVIPEIKIPLVCGY